MGKTISVSNLCSKVDQEDFNEKFKWWLRRDGLSQGWEKRLFTYNKNWSHWCVLHRFITDKNMLWYFCEKFPIFATGQYLDRLDDKQKATLFKIKETELARRKIEQERMIDARRSN